MPYFCDNPGCIFQVNEYPYPESGNCPACGKPFILKVNFDLFELDVINNYPYVIAYPFKRMQEETHYFTKFSLLKDVFVNTLKYNALLVATEYFKSPHKSEEINNLFLKKLSRPHHGEWNEFLNETIKFLEEKDYNFFVSGLTNAYHKIETGKKNYKVIKYNFSTVFTNSKGKVETENQELTGIYALLKYRNLKFAHTQTPSNEEFKKLYATCYAILKDILASISFCKDFLMYKAGNQYCWSLMGAEVKKAFRLTTLVSNNENVWIQNKNGERLSLLPFFVQPTQFMAGVNESLEVLMYEGNTGKKGRIIFDCPAESIKPEVSGEILNKFYELLRYKQIVYDYNINNFNKQQLKLQISRQNRKVFKELKEEEKLIEGVYCRREDAELALKNWIGARAGLFVLTSDAGSGKTNLFWEIKRQYEQLGLNAVMLRANRFNVEDLSKELIYLFHLPDNFSFENCEAFINNQDKPLIILIDGINEALNPEQLLNSIKVFLNKFTIGTVKVLISWRINSKNDLPEFNSSWDELYYNANYANDLKETSQNKHYQLQLLNKIELQNAWNDFVMHSKESKYKVDFTLNELTEIDRPLADQLSNPLILKLFLELFSGSELSTKNKGFTNIWDTWWQKNIVSESSIEYFLIELAVLMADHQTNKFILDTTLFENEKIGKQISEIQIDSSYQQLLNSNILTQFSLNNCMYVTFTIESVLHYALCQYLVQQPNIELKLSDYATKGKHWSQAVEFFLWKEINKQNLELIAHTVKNSSIPSIILIRPLASAIFIIKPEKILNAILPNSNDRIWEILENTVDYIDKSQQKQLVDKIVQLTENWMNFSLLNCVQFVSKYLKLFNKEFARKIAEQLENNFINNEISIIQINILNNLANFYTYVGWFDKAMEFYQKVLEKKLIFYGEDHGEVAWSIVNIANIFNEKGYYDDALEYNNKGLIMSLNIFNENSPIVAHIYQNIAFILKNKNKNTEALNFYEKALKIAIQNYGDDHTNCIAIYSNMALILDILGRPDEAIVYCQKSLSSYLKFYGNNHPEVATSYSNIASILKGQEKYSEAYNYLQKALATRLKFYEKTHPAIGNSYNNIAVILKKENKFDIALEYYQKALVNYTLNYGKEHPKLATVYDNIGNVLSELCKLDEAMLFYQKSLEIKLNIYEKEDSKVLFSHFYIVSLLEKQGKHEEAKSYFEKIIKP